MKKRSLFDSEEKTIAKANRHLEQLGKEDTAFSGLLLSYERLFKQTKRLVRLSDRQQLRMNVLNESLELRKRFIQGVFGRYLSDEIVEELLDSPEGLQLGGEKRNLTIMMTDLRGFTSLAERFSAEQVLDMLNHYLEKMTEIILEHQGTIDEILGDGLLIIFGAPVYRQDNALRAIKCALDMQLAMASVNEWNEKKNYPSLSLGIGINTGEMVVGNIGSLKRTKYGVVGAEVNLTARVESYTVGGQILVSESTHSACPEKLIIPNILEVLPKGCSKPIQLFDVKGFKNDLKRQLPLSSLSKMEPLNPPKEILLKLLSGKDVGTETHAGSLFACSKEGSRLQTKAGLAPLDNIVLVFSDTEVYGKITGIADSANHLFDVVFTSVSSEIQTFLKQLGFS